MNLFAHILDIRHLRNDVVRRCHEQGLTVRFEEGAPTAYTNRNEVVFPEVQPPITMDQLKKLRCAKAHEPGHRLRFKSIELLEQATLPKGHPLGALWNIVEDEIMEREVQTKWRGDRVDLVEGHHVIARETASSWKEGLEKGHKAGENAVKAIAAYLVAIESRKDWDWLAEANDELIRRPMPKEVTDLADALIAEGWADRIRKGGDEDEAHQLAKDLFNRLYPNEDADEEEQKYKQAAKSKGEDGDEEGEGEGEGAKSTERFEDAEENEQGEEQLTVKWEDVIKSEHDQSSEGSPMRIDWEGKTYDKNTKFFPDDCIRVHEYRNFSGHNVFGTSSLEDRAFANMVRRMIQSWQRTHKVDELKSGKLDHRNMIRVLMPQRDGGEWNRRVFYQMEEHTSLNTCITLLVDYSGSMYGDKMKVACRATQRLLDVFERCLRVPTEVIGFSAGWNQHDVGLIKPYDERGVSANDIGSRFSSFMAHSNGNADADAILYAAQRMVKRREQRKILIVLSDGSPSVGYDNSSAYDNLKYIIEEVHRMRIETHGIGIQSNSVCDFYGSHTKVINRTEELNQALLSTLERAVRFDTP